MCARVLRLARTLDPSFATGFGRPHMRARANQGRGSAVFLQGRGLRACGCADPRATSRRRHMEAARPAEFSLGSKVFSDQIFSRESILVKTEDIADKWPF
jgi:hypothetical protein